MKGDLHTHTTYSDGVLTPRELVDLAKQKGITHLAITDHDCTTGALEAYDLNDPEIRIIVGVELSTELNGESVHILGYFPNPRDAALMQIALYVMAENRRERAHQMLDLLEKHFNIVLDREFIKTNHSVTRGRIAREIIKQGYPYTRKEIFTKFLGKDSPAYLPASTLTPKQGINILKEHHAIPVLAHPMLLDNNDPKAIMEMGVLGLEARYFPRLEVEAQYRELAKQYGLFVTGGSDYHQDNDGSHANLGAAFLEAADLQKFLKILDH